MRLALSTDVIGTHRMSLSEWAAWKLNHSQAVPSEGRAPSAGTMDVSSMLALTLFSWPPVSQSSPPSHRHKLYFLCWGGGLGFPFPGPTRVMEAHFRSQLCHQCRTYRGSSPSQCLCSNIRLNQSGPHTERRLCFKVQRARGDLDIPPGHCPQHQNTWKTE